MLDTKRRSTAQEKKVAKEIGGRVTPASGALWGSKADVRNEQFLVECKTTEKEQYALSYLTWEKVRHEALNDGFREPVMCIDLSNGSHRLAVLDHGINLDYLSWVRAQGYTSDFTPISISKSSKSLKYTGKTLVLVFCNKRPLSVKKDIELVVTPWEQFKEYLNLVDRGERDRW